jgi:hypothetical protein
MGHIYIGPSEEIFSIATMAFYEDIKKSDLPEPTQEKILRAFSAQMTELVTSKRETDEKAGSPLSEPKHIALTVPLLCSALRFTARTSIWM